MGAETVDAAILHAQRHNTSASPIFHDQIESEILNEKRRVVAQALPIQRVQHGMAGAVSGGTRALGWRAVTKILHHAAERALINLAFLRARKRHSEMF